MFDIETEDHSFPCVYSQSEELNMDEPRCLLKWVILGVNPGVLTGGTVDGSKCSNEAETVIAYQWSYMGLENVLNTRSRHRCISPAD